MQNDTKYIRLHWKIEGLSCDIIKTSKKLKSQKFNVNFADGNYLQWCLQFQTQSPVDNKSLPIFESKIQDLDENCEEINDGKEDEEECFGILLSLLNCHMAKSQSLMNSLLNLKIYMIDNCGDERLQFAGSHIKLKICNVNGFEGGWGARLSWNRILGQGNKFYENDSLKFSVLMQLHILSQEQVDIPRPFENLLSSSMFSDFKILCDEREFLVHRAILYTYSRFHTAIPQLLNAQSNEATVNDINGNIFMEMLRFIYTGKVENLKEHAHDLAYAADKFRINDLKAKCIQCLSLHLNMENLFDVFALACHLKEETLKINCGKLMNYQIKKLKQRKVSKKFEQNLFVEVFEIAQKYGKAEIYELATASGA